ncbi:MAG: N-acetylmuramoyl-L-alanine amidase [Verrucomicrobiota bacterium]
MRRTVPWFGLFLLAASFVWFVLIPPEKEVAVKQPIHRPAFEEPFSIVVFDPGHGGQDSGAICGNVLEKDLALDVGRRAEQLARAQGLQTVMTRSDDRYVSLGERAAIANRQRNCIFVSIHFNDVKRSAVSGVETYYALPAIAGAPVAWSGLPFGQQMLTEPPNAESQCLASFIQDALVAHTQAVNRGTKPEQFYVLANVWHPAVLVEAGFITNKFDVSKLGNEQYREQIARAISEGIAAYREVVRHNQPTLALAMPRSE